LRAATVTVNVADWPGRTARDEGVTAIAKSGLGGSTVIVRVGGLGSGGPAASITGGGGTLGPGIVKVTFPRVWAGGVGCGPPGKIHEYWAAVEVVLKETEPPAMIVVSAAGDVIVPTGGGVV